MIYQLVFDEVILKQLQQAAKNNHIKEILKKMLDRLEESGPAKGKLLDSQLFIYELKIKHPPLRLYFKHNKNTQEIYIFKYEMKTSQTKQQKTIEEIRRKLLKS